MRRAFAVLAVLVAACSVASAPPPPRLGMLTTSFEAEWTRCALPTRGPALALRGRALGRGAPAALAPRPDAMRAGARMVHDRGQVLEWYEPRPDGLEQGFTLPERPSGNGPLVLDVEIGAELVPTAHGPFVDLRPRSGRGASYRYGALDVRDADGRVLAAKLGVEAGHIRITTEDEAARYPVTIDPLIWAIETLVGNDIGGREGGSSVAIDGDTIATVANEPQSVDVWRPNGTHWERENVTSYITSGYAPAAVVGISGDTVMTANGGMLALYEHARDTGWLPAGGGGSGIGISGGGGGTPHPAALRGNVAAVVNPYVADDDAHPIVLDVYVRANGTWSGTDRVPLEHTLVDLNCYAVAIDDDRIAVGTGVDVLVYERGADQHWALASTALRVTPATASSFGCSIAFQGDTLLVIDRGVPSLDVYARSGTTWTRTQHLVEPGVTRPTTIRGFGESVALSGDVAFVSDPSRPPGGSVFQYARKNGTWSLEQELLPPEGTSSIFFGDSIATNGKLAVIGDVGIDGLAGGAWIYSLQPGAGEPCTNAASCASGFCVDGVCCESACGDGDASDCLTCAHPDTPGRCVAAVAGASCRPSANECDAPEQCDGTRTSCPADAVVLDGTTCAGGTCAAGKCAAPELEAGAPPADAGTATETVDAPTSRSGCSATARTSTAPTPWLLLVALLARRRRRR